MQEDLRMTNVYIVMSRGNSLEVPLFCTKVCQVQYMQEMGQEKVMSAWKVQLVHQPFSVSGQSRCLRRCLLHSGGIFVELTRVYENLAKLCCFHLTVTDAL